MTYQSLGLIFEFEFAQLDLVNTGRWTSRLVHSGMIDSVPLLLLLLLPLLMRVYHLSNGFAVVKMTHPESWVEQCRKWPRHGELNMSKLYKHVA